MYPLLLICRLCPSIFSSIFLHAWCLLGSFQDHDQEREKEKEEIPIDHSLQEGLVEGEENFNFSLNVLFAKSVDFFIHLSFSICRDNCALELFSFLDHMLTSLGSAPELLMNQVYHKKRQFRG